jgi:hypothetical protein
MIYAIFRLESVGKKGDTDASRSEILLREQGYMLGVKTSSIQGAGRGVYLTKGKVKAGDVSCTHTHARTCMHTCMSICPCVWHLE